MSHLTVDELIDFVSETELNEQTVALFAAVNGHIRRCESGRRRSHALQTLHDEFTRLCLEEDFRQFLEQRLSLSGEAELSNGYAELDYHP